MREIDSQLLEKQPKVDLTRKSNIIMNKAKSEKKFMNRTSVNRSTDHDTATSSYFPNMAKIAGEHRKLASEEKSTVNPIISGKKQFLRRYKI